MAYFALVVNGIVQRVEPVASEVITTEKGNESELRGKRFMVSLYPETVEDNWAQCFDDGFTRGAYPGQGFVWDGVEFSSPVVPDPVPTSSPVLVSK